MISELAARAQYDYCKELHWLSYFEDASKKYGFDVSLILAIGSRETNLRNILGDYGHGAGIMQVDIGTNRNFVVSGAWRNPQASIDTGCSILAEKLTLAKQAGIPENYLIRVTVASYNCGGNAILAYHKRENVDAYTTGHNYSTDVLSRQPIFQSFINEDTHND